VSTKADVHGRANDVWLFLRQGRQSWFRTASIAGGVALLFVMMLGLFGIQSGRRDRIDCRSARRNRVARIEPQYFTTDDGRNEYRRDGPFGSDQQDRPSSRW
jgi:hypothetical protein